MSPEISERAFEEAIDRLKELRTALISTAVKGKIDVRLPAGAPAQTEEEVAG